MPMGFLSRLFGNSTGPEIRNAWSRAAEVIETIDPWDLPSVVASRSLVADLASILPLVAHNGSERVEPTPTILRRPDPSETYRSSIERIVNSMTRDGAAWLRTTAIGSNGHPLAVEVVEDAHVSAMLDPTQTRIANLHIRGIEVPVREMTQIPMILDPGPLGRSPLEDIRATLENLAETLRYSAEYYGAGAVPPYAVTVPNRLTADQAQSFADQWFEARAERRPAILSGGVTLETFSPTSAADALLLDAVSYADTVVARIMMIPPSLLNVASYTSLTYSTTLGERQRFLTLGLYPMFLSRIESAFSELLPRGQSAIFDTSNLLRADSAARIDSYSTSIAAGIHTVAEVRALEGLPAVPDPDPVAIAPNVEGL